MGTYAGTSCTNQFVRSLDGSIAATCATVGSADVAGLDISADTNLTAGDNLTLTDDDLDLDTTLTNMVAATFSGLITAGNLLSNGSTTLQNFTALQSTTTQSTSTNFFATTLNGTNSFISSLLTSANILATGSSTLQNFTGLNSTTTNATSTSLSTGLLTVTGSATSTFTAGVNTATLNVTGSATNTFANGINLSSGCFAVGNTCLTSSSASASGVSGEIAFFNGASSLVSDPQLTYNSANDLFTVTRSTLGVATSTTLLVTSSTTLQNFTAINGTTTNSTSTSLAITSLASGGLAVRADGSIYAAATTTAGTGLTYSGNAFNVNTSQNITTLSNLTGNGAILTSGGNGTLGTYAGTSCTNQFVRSLDGSIAATCATVGSADVAGLDISADTNLTAGDNLTLTDDDLDLDTTLTNMVAATFSGLITAGNLLSNGSTTLQNFTALQSTTTQSTSTNFFATTLNGTNSFISSLLTSANILATGSSTLQNFTGLNSTTTNATSTSLSTGLLTVTGSATSTFTAGVNTATLNVTGSATNTFANGINLSSGCFAVGNTCLTSSSASASGVSGEIAFFNGASSLVSDPQLTYNSANDLFTVTRSTLGVATSTTLLVTSSTTLQNFTAINGTTTNATSTGAISAGGALTVSGTSVLSGLVTGTNGFLANASSTLQNLTFINATGTQATTTSFFSTTGTHTNAFITSLFTSANILATGSSTLQNFTGINSTTTQSTSTNFFATSLTGTNAFINSLLTSANILSTGSSTLQNFTGLNSTTTNATSTTLSTGLLTVTGSATSTFTAGINTAAINTTGSATSTFSGIRVASQGLTIATLTGCNGTSVLETDANGNLQCGADAGGAGGTPGGGTGALQFNDGASGFAGDVNYLKFDDTNNLFGIGTSTPWAALSASTTSSNPLAVFDQRGTGGLLTLQQGGIDKFAVANSGGLTISGETSDIAKSTVSTGRSTDFDYTGSTFTNTATSSDGNVNLNRGTIPNNHLGIASSPAATTTAVATYSGSHVIMRDDGQYVIIHGGSTFTASIWNGDSASMTSVTVAAGAVGAGGGSLSLKRPDGRYLLVHGATTTQTSIFDPYNRVTAIAGPTLSCTAADGTFAIQRDDGRYVVYCGGSTGTAIYDPVANTSSAGPTSLATIRQGAQGLRRPDGGFLILAGGNSTSAFHYSQNTGTTGTGSNSSSITITNMPTISSGSFSIQLRDGTYLIMPGTLNTSTIYDPRTTASTTNSGVGTMTTNGFGPTANLRDGAQSVFRQDGSYLLLLGSGQTATNIIDPANVNNTSGFIAGPSLANAMSSTTVAFMRPDGTYAITRAGGSTAMDLYDMGFVVGGTNTTGPRSGIYESECMTVSELNSNSTMAWSIAGEGYVTFEAKTGTGSCSGSYKAINKSEDLIDNAITTQDRVQVRVTFKRPLPQFLDQDWGVRRPGMTRYPRNILDPALSNFVINNNNLYKRSTFTFGNATSSPSGPVTINITNKTDGVGLSFVQSANNEYFRTQNAASAGTQLYDGSFATTTPLLTGIASSSLVMKRPDGKYVIIAGSTSTPNAQVYDADLKTVTALGVVPAPYGINVNIGPGTLAIKRPDGKFFFTLGEAVNTAGSGATSTTVIFDPVANTFTAGPALTGVSGRGALPIPLPNGRVLILHGNFTTRTSIYDPLTDTMMQGPATNAVVIGSGSFAIARPDGTYMVHVGASTAVCGIVTTILEFDPYQMTFRTSTGITMSVGGANGALMFQRTDGTWFYVQGGAAASGTNVACQPKTTTSIIAATNDPRVVTGPVITIPGGGVRFEGNLVMPRPDGTWTMVTAGASTTVRTQHYEEWNGAYTSSLAGPGVNGAIGSWVAGVSSGFWAGGTTTGAVQNTYGSTGPGATALQLDNGKFLMLGGAASAANVGIQMFEYDGGWASYGKYASEQINVPDLDTDSVLVWKVKGSYDNISAEVKTAPTQLGLATATPRTIEKPGSKINPNTGDVWLQVLFHFKRTFPSYAGYGGLLEDVWTGNGPTPQYPLRKIADPVLTEISVTKDFNLIDLQSDGLSVFRVSSSGDVYGASGATINTSGADLAERYLSQEPLLAGEVVTVDPRFNHSVKKSKYQYQPDVLGVVSTDPGFVTGAYTKNSFPIALVGRVPVKVSTENGMIKAGDFLTAASVPGYAMKATISGKVIGKALETIDSTKLGECPESEFIIRDRMCTSVMMFVNLIDYNGASVDEVMGEWYDRNARITSLQSSVGLDIATSSESSPITIAGTTTSQFSVSQNRKADQILVFLEALREERENAVTGAKSEIFTDRISAISQIISPEMVTRLLSVEKIEAGEINGLTINTEKLSAKEINTDKLSFNNGYSIEVSEDGKLIIRKLAISNSVLATSTIEMASTTDVTASTTLNVENGSVTDLSEVLTIDLLGNAIFGGEISAKNLSFNQISLLGNVFSAFATTTISTTEGTTTSTSTTLSLGQGLLIGGKTILDGGLIVDTISGSEGKGISFMSDTVFFGTPYFTTDTAGFAVIEKGAKNVQIRFDREYIEKPIVGANIALSSGESTTTPDSIFSDDVRYIVTSVSNNGFTITLNKKAPDNIRFSWTAFSVKNAKVFTEISPPVAENVTTIESPPPDLDENNTSTTTPPVTEVIGEEVPAIIPSENEDILDSAPDETTPDSGGGAELSQNEEMPQ